MSELLTKIQTTITAIDDIEKAIQERGLSTKGYTLLEYGNLIRRITGGGGSLYPDYATLVLKCITKVKTFVTEIHNIDSYVGVFTPELQWFTTDANNMFNFKNDIIAVETFVAEKTDKNTKNAIITDSTNQLVEIIEVKQEEV